MNNDKWLPVQDFDRQRRLPNEWAQLYHVKLQGDIEQRRINEYEWAYLLGTVRYFPAAVPDTPTWDRYEDMQYRGDELRRDLILGADSYEREVLTSRYLETQWVRARFSV